jgi:hypothetical protein
MKNSFYFLLLLIAFIYLSCSSLKDESKYFNDVYKFSDIDIEKDYAYEIVDTLKDGIYNIRHYSKDSILILSFFENSESENVGEYKSWYSNGNLQEIKNYNQKSQYHGEIKTFYENGNKKRHDYFKNNKLDSGTCWDISGKLIKHFDYEKEPTVDLQLLSKSLIYPENMRRISKEDRIYIRLLLDPTGTPIKFKYDNKHSKEFISEIARVIMIPGIFRPAFIENVPIECWITIPINFRLR